MACQLTQQVRWQQYQNSLLQSGDLYEDFKKAFVLVNEDSDISTNLCTVNCKRVFGTYIY